MLGKALCPLNLVRHFCDVLLWLAQLVNREEDSNGTGWEDYDESLYCVIYIHLHSSPLQHVHANSSHALMCPPWPLCLSRSSKTALELRMWVTDDPQEYAQTNVVCVSFRGTVEIQECLVLLVHQAWRWVEGYLCVNHFNIIWTVIKTLRQYCGYILLHLLNFSNHVILVEKHEMLQWHDRIAL